MDFQRIWFFNYLYVFGIVFFLEFSQRNFGSVVNEECVQIWS